MRLIKTYDIFVPAEDVHEAVSDKHTDLVKHANVYNLLREAFKLGREAEQKDRAEEAAAKEGGIVHSVQSK